MRFKVLTSTPVMDALYGETFDYEPGTPADPATRFSQPYNHQAWIDAGLVEVVDEPKTKPASAAPEGA